jgi:hypothetical protein
MSQARPDYRLPAQHLLSAALSAALASCTAQSARKMVAEIKDDEALGLHAPALKIDVRTFSEDVPN